MSLRTMKGMRQIQTVPSVEPVAMVRPSGLMSQNKTELAGDGAEFPPSLEDPLCCKANTINSSSPRFFRAWRFIGSTRATFQAHTSPSSPAENSKSSTGSYFSWHTKPLWRQQHPTQANNGGTGRAAVVMGVMSQKKIQPSSLALISTELLIFPR